VILGDHHRTQLLSSLLENYSEGIEESREDRELRIDSELRIGAGGWGKS
jgi:hypothetical protein